MSETIGIIAGGGQFPLLVAQGARQEGYGVVVVTFPGHMNESESSALSEVASEICELKLGQLNKQLNFFKKHGVKKIAMAGTINKPRAMDFRPDWRAAKLVMKMAAKPKGDAALLGVIIEDIQSEGFTVVPPHELAPDLLTPEGVLTRRKPTKDQWQDLKFAWRMAKAVGELDIGQCVVVREGIVAAVEALEGTDAAIERGAKLAGKGVSVVKVFKPGQQKRVDLPSVGLATVERLAELDGACLGVEAGHSLFFDLEKSIELADRHKIALVGLTSDMIE